MSPDALKARETAIAPVRSARLTLIFGEGGLGRSFQHTE
jgi:hypothetical protein